MNSLAVLALEDGSIFLGLPLGHMGETGGEVVFNTAMTGYQEILTDPSYASQIVSFTYPHIGNTGINLQDNESNSAQIAGIIVKDLPLAASNWRQSTSLDSYLKAEKVVGITAIDTRQLTRILRLKGSLNGYIISGSLSNKDTLIKDALKKAKLVPSLDGLDLAQTVTCKKTFPWTSGNWDAKTNSYPTFQKTQLPFHVVVYDFGVKHTILRMLVQQGCRVTVVPAKTPVKEILPLNPDGVMLTNGPGDPKACTYAIANIRQLLAMNMPIFGICLGHQLLALASGATTIRMKFGHHGANHPIQCLDSNEVMISSQNHGFTVDKESLPKNLRATHVSLFDGSLQGIERTDTPAFGFQGHPEASPGPTDVNVLFKRFVSMIKIAQKHN